jgi:hypothetical protein
LYFVQLSVSLCVFRAPLPGVVLEAQRQPQVNNGVAQPPAMNVQAVNE